MASLKYLAASLSILALSSAADAAAAPQDVASPVAAISHCRSISANAERLACYDKEAEALDTALAQRDITVINKEEMKRTRRSLFGFSLPNLTAFGLDKEDDNSPEATTLDSTIRAVHGAGYDHWDFVLAEGDATWRNTDPLEERPAVGANVHIHKGLLGTYFVKVGKGRAFRAIRVH
ncbi:hypothetical protein [Sphingomonas sp. PR090111-T3T-6A]|uniref:hypothetical protein n=1 Tax=Sphingomonas sp. PR090111-T3T-6A TaxID=685778 RepID=UPI00037DE047|nr:hypothetical protein [Sphingomonas sp. PR090111-T3T-6A]